MASPRFAVYMGLLCGAAIFTLVWPAVAGHAFEASLLPFVYLTLLYGFAEYGAVLFNKEEGSVAFGVGDAVLVTAFAVLPAGEAIWVVAGGSVLAASLLRIPLVKASFNVAASICAGGLGSLVSVGLSDLAPGSIVVTIGAAAVGVVVYALVTHALVAGAIATTEKDASLWSAITDVPRAFLVGLGSSLLVGSIFAAAYFGTKWSLMILPLALLSLYLGYRAVMQQANERQRVESLHSASRALAAVPNLAEAIPGFLRSVAATVSALGAQTVIRESETVLVTKVYAGDLISQQLPSDDAELTALLDELDRTRQPVVVGYEVPAQRKGLVENLSARDLVAVPLIEGESVLGCLIVQNKVGAETFGEREVRLLEALGNELTATMSSHRLFDEVAEERERFQLLVESVHDYAIFMLDPTGHVVSWNKGAERIQGFPASDIVGKHFSRFYPAEGEAWRKELETAARDGRFEVEGGVRVRKDGSEFLANEVVTSIRDEEGELRGFAKVTRDITERVQAQREKDSLEAQLHQVQKLESVGQLAGGIAHDFNNILAVISNCSDFVLDALGTMKLEGEDREIVQDVEEIKTASERARALTRQLLVFSRKDAAEPRVLDMNDVITNMTKLMRRAVGENVAIRTELDAPAGLVFADPGQLEQVLLNLAINARDAMAGTGSLVISTSEVTLDESAARRFVELPPGRYVRVEVTDTGSGMPPDVIEKAFDPFFTTKPKGQGTGLGLATVYGIVRKARGHIGIRSKPGLGTTFTIHLPLAVETSEEVGMESEPEVPRGNGERVLLVEDESAVRAVARRLLREAGYEVIEADNASAALQLMNDELGRVDILVSDVVMPGMSGIELGQTLQSMYPRLPAVYMTGYSEASSYASELGDKSTLLHKPFDRIELLTAIHKMLHPEVQPAAS